MKQTVKFLNNNSEEACSIIDISAYVDASETDITERIARLFSSFRNDDEIVVLTDMMGGSVNQKFFPYRNERVHVITGMNLPLAMLLLLYPEDEELNADVIEGMVEEARGQILYMNTFEQQEDEADE